MFADMLGVCETFELFWKLCLSNIYEYIFVYFRNNSDNGQRRPLSELFPVKRNS